MYLWIKKNFFLPCLPPFNPLTRKLILKNVKGVKKGEKTRFTLSIHGHSLFHTLFLYIKQIYVLYFKTCLKLSIVCYKNSLAMNR